MAEVNVHTWCIGGRANENRRVRGSLEEESSVVNSKYRKYLRTPAKACCEKTCGAIRAAEPVVIVSAIASTSNIHCSVSALSF